MIEGNGRGKYRRKSSILIAVRCVIALQRETMTLKRLAHEAKCAKETARRMVNQLLSAEFIEFKGWAPRTGTGHLAATYRWKP